MRACGSSFCAPRESGKGKATGQRDREAGGGGGGPITKVRKARLEGACAGWEPDKSLDPVT
jgi:hypothetical protein